MVLRGWVAWYLKSHEGNDGELKAPEGIKSNITPEAVKKLHPRDRDTAQEEQTVVTNASGQAILVKTLEGTKLTGFVWEPLNRIE